MQQTGVAVVGAGPLGAATALALVGRGVADVTLLDGDHGDHGDDGDDGDDGGDGPGAAFPNSGGSICWYRPDRRKADLIRETAEHVRRRVAAGARIRVRELPYLMLEHGVQVPALNVDSVELVADLVAEAVRGGAGLYRSGRVAAVSPGSVPGRWRIDAALGAVEARVVVLALGSGNVGLLPDLEPRLEKRQLFVLDLPVDDDRARLPHVVARLGNGYAYVFVKDFPYGRRVVLGQEDLVEDGDTTGPSDHFYELLDAGVADAFPFLRSARPERILWGMDWTDKYPRITAGHPAGAGSALLAVNCGSGVRACIAAGRIAADAAESALESD